MSTGWHCWWKSTGGLIDVSQALDIDSSILWASLTIVLKTLFSGYPIIHGRWRRSWNNTCRGTAVDLNVLLYNMSSSMGLGYLLIAHIGYKFHQYQSKKRTHICEPKFLEILFKLGLIKRNKNKEMFRRPLKRHYRFLFTDYIVYLCKS